MGIQPIDLQTLYSQLDNVSKTVVAQQQGAQLHSVLQNEAQAKKLQEKKETVTETQFDESDVSVKERKEHQANDSFSKSGSNKKQSDGDDLESPKDEVIRDSDLGRHIDITG